MDAETTTTIALVLVGLGGVSAGAVGIGLPAGERLAAGLALVVGAGVGVIALAIGTRIGEDAEASYANVFLVASALGLLATIAALVALWRRATRERGTGSAATER